MSLIYIVSRGLDVVTQSQWCEAMRTSTIGRMDRMYHLPVMLQPIAFSHEQPLAVEHPDIPRAFRRISKLSGSKANVVADPEDSHVRLQTIDGAVALALSARRIRNIVGAKAVTADGISMAA